MKPNALILLLTLSCWAQAQQIQEPGYTHSLLAIYPGAPAYAYGAVIEHASGDLYAVGGNNSYLNRMGVGEAGFSAFVQMPTGTPQALAIAGDTAYVGSGDRIYAVDLTAPTPTPILVAQAQDPILGLTLTEDGSSLAVGSNGSAELVALVSGQSTPVADQGDMSAVVPTSGQQFRSTDYQLSRLLAFSPPSFGGAVYLSPTAPGPDGLAVHPFTGDTYIACAGSASGQDVIQKLDAVSGQLSTFVSGLDLHDDRRATALTFSIDGSTLYYGSAQFGVYVISTIEGFTSQAEQLRASLPPSLNGTTQIGDVMIQFDAESARGLSVSATLEYSVDGGVSFYPCSAGDCSALGNPSGSLGAVALGSQFIWNSFDDGLGFSLVEPVELRLTVSDGELMVSDTSIFSVDNRIWNSLADGMCHSWFSGDMSIVYDADTTGGSTMNVTLEYSTDSGMTFDRCATAASSPTSNPSGSVPTPIVASEFIWNSFADGIGLLVPRNEVILQLSVDDGARAIDRVVTIGIDNSPGVITCASCGDCDGNTTGPDILDSLQSAKIAAAILEPSPTQRNCCDANSSGSVDVLDSLLLAQIASGLPVAASCP